MAVEELQKNYNVGSTPAHNQMGVFTSISFRVFAKKGVNVNQYYDSAKPIATAKIKNRENPFAGWSPEQIGQAVGIMVQQAAEQDTSSQYRQSRVYITHILSLRFPSMSYAERMAVTERIINENISIDKVSDNRIEEMRDDIRAEQEKLQQQEEQEKAKKQQEEKEKEQKKEKDEKKEDDKDAKNDDKADKDAQNSEDDADNSEEASASGPSLSR